LTTLTFTWPPRVEPSGTATYSTLKAKFGDGYEQHSADGINNKSQSWPVSFVGVAAYITPIRDFLDARAGYQSFYWTPPLGVQGTYKAGTHSLKALGNGKYELMTTFEQSFQP